MPCVKYDDEAPVVNADDDSSAESEIYYERDYFPTKLAGKIVNAWSGAPYHYNQGSCEELRLYKFIDARAFHDEFGCRITRFDVANRTPNFLYYDSPEQCMRHLDIKLNAKRVKTWHTNQSKMFTINGEFNKDEWLKIKQESYAEANRIRA